MLRLVLFLILTSSCSALAQGNLTPGELYTRCYSRLTRSPISSTDTVLSQVKAGTKNPVTACMELFDKAQFQASGSAVQMKNPNDVLGRKVVRSLHSMHFSWFDNRALSDFGASSASVIDIEEPALYFTRVLFTPSTNLQEVLTHPTALTGIRSRPAGRPAFGALSFFNPKDFANSNNFMEVFRLVYRNYQNSSGPLTLDLPDSAIVQTGELIGVKTPNTLNSPAFRSPGNYINVGALRGEALVNANNPSEDGIILSEELNTLQMKKQIEYLRNKNTNLVPHHGGGVLGSNAFIMQNTNVPRLQIPFKERLNHRRLAATVFEKLLCHELPSLNTADAQAMTLASSEHSFQTNSSCMGCHASIDPLARAYKKVYIVFTLDQNAATNPGFPVATTLSFGADQTGTNASEFDWVMKDYTDAAETGDKAKLKTGLYFRSLKIPASTGSFPIPYQTARSSKVAISSIADMGAKLSSPTTDLGFDFHACTAKRYYKYFTGVDVQLRPQTAENSRAAYHRSMVLKLANDLRSHKKLRTLIQKIFESETFQTRNYLSE